VIDVLVPVLNRPANVASLVESFLSTTSALGEIHFLCTPGDDAQIAACEESGQHVIVVGWPARKHDYALKMNYGFRQTERPFLLLAADDVTFTPGWGEAALECAGEYGVIGTNDMASAHVMSGRSSTHPLVRRSYIEEYGGSYDGPGVLIHPGYDHNFSERELIDIAKKRKQWVFCKRSVIKHRHPLWKTEEWDDTYRKAMKNFHRDFRLFNHRRRRYTRAL
jgi:glycosyltransferase involved in cell wall biosynthesis